MGVIGTEVCRLAAAALTASLRLPSTNAGRIDVSQSRSEPISSSGRGFTWPDGISGAPTAWPLGGHYTRHIGVSDRASLADSFFVRGPPGQMARTAYSSEKSVLDRCMSDLKADAWDSVLQLFRHPGVGSTRAGVSDVNFS